MRSRAYAAFSAMKRRWVGARLGTFAKPEYPPSAHGNLRGIARWTSLRQRRWRRRRCGVGLEGRWLTVWAFATADARGRVFTRGRRALVSPLSVRGGGGEEGQHANHDDIEDEAVNEPHHGAHDKGGRIPAGSGSGTGAGLPHAVAAAARKASIFGGGIC